MSHQPCNFALSLMTASNKAYLILSYCLVCPKAVQKILFTALWWAVHCCTEYEMMLGCILVFWEEWQNHIVECEEITLSKIFDWNAKLKTDKSKYWWTVKCEYEMLKRDKCEVRLSWQDPDVLVWFKWMSFIWYVKYWQTTYW